jgi:hypothetical protein
MDNSKSLLNIWSISSFLCIIIGLMSWILSVVIPSLNPPFDKGLSIILLTFIVNPIGIILSLIALRKEYPYSAFLIVGNLVMTLSIYPVTIIGTLILGP